ncbi:hypothetical protein [Chitinophaga silvisoli]|uniref:Uncharacterized protein n=1 Tax=Chitinophaga silvisoli TaxID=2291814 RepID=A0A3E1NSD0_9BACT|nr:hypothetical protein [Chitinophaga silvisoli]RFM30668.1 hypothetical protein DXN04_32515 [Chitinophaga silvisoli]
MRWIFTLLISTALYGQSSSLDEINIKWNKRTLSDMAAQLKSEIDDPKLYYRDSINYLNYLEMLSVDSIDEISDRFTFLKNVSLSYPNFFNDYYVIELTKLGELLRTYKFIVEVNENHTVNVYGFLRIAGDWKSVGISKGIKLELRELNEIIVDNKGLNIEKIIVSHFKVDNVLLSKYFGPFTLPGGNFISKVLSMYLSSYERYYN